MSRETMNRVVVLMLVVFVSVLFFRMIKGMFLALFMAAILAGLMNGVFNKLCQLFRQRRGVAAVVTELLLVFLIIIPLGGLAGLVTAQAIKVGNNISPWVMENLSQPDEISARLEALPFYESIAPYRTDIITKAGEAAGTVSNWLVAALSNATMGTVQFLFLFFVMLYSLFFFLLHGNKVLDKILYYLPLEDHDERIMLDKFTSVTRATLKGTLMIGFAQGFLGGAAFWAVGIEGFVFWGAVMVVLSVIPGLGTGLIWVPAAVVLAMSGAWGKVIGMSLFFILVVGMMDNVIRPRVVGHDTQMPELLIFLATLGGLSLFGALGFIIGPIVGALVVTIWEIYGETFKELLPAVKTHSAD